MGHVVVEHDQGASKDLEGTTLPSGQGVGSVVTSVPSRVLQSGVALPERAAVGAGDHPQAAVVPVCVLEGEPEARDALGGMRR